MTMHINILKHINGTPYEKKKVNGLETMKINNTEEKLNHLSKLEVARKSLDEMFQAKVRASGKTSYKHWEVYKREFGKVMRSLDGEINKTSGGMSTEEITDLIIKHCQGQRSAYTLRLKNAVPCPKCKTTNSLKIYIEKMPPWGEAHQVRCTTCNTHGEMRMLEQAAINVWNEAKGTPIKPCPCCASVGIATSRGISEGIHIRCSNSDCGMRTSNKPREIEAIKAWNKRSGKGDILFRGELKNGSGWVYGDFLHDYQDRGDCIRQGAEGAQLSGSDRMGIFPVKPETVRYEVRQTPSETMSEAINQIYLLEGLEED